MTRPPRYGTARRRSLILALAACVLYGGWAWFANRSYGMAAALQALMTQGSLSFGSTWGLTLSMETLFRWSTRPAVQIGLALTGTCGAMVASNVGLHWLLGTPALWATVTPVLGLGACYCSLYSLGLWRLHCRQTGRVCGRAVGSE